MNPWPTVIGAIVGALIAGTVALWLDKRRRATDAEVRSMEMARDDRLRLEQVGREDQIRSDQQAREDALLHLVRSREDDRRWDEELRKAASLFIEAVTSAAATGATVQNALNLDKPEVGIDEFTKVMSIDAQYGAEAMKERQKTGKRRADLQKPLDEARALMKGRLASLCTIAPEGVQVVAIDLEHLTRQLVKASGEERRELRKQADSRLDDLTKEVKKALRVSG